MCLPVVELVVGVTYGSHQLGRIRIDVDLTLAVGRLEQRAEHARDNDVADHSGREIETVEEIRLPAFVVHAHVNTRRRRQRQRIRRLVHVQLDTQAVYLARFCAYSVRNRVTARVTTRIEFVA